MGFNDILKKLFGNKAMRDLKEIEPYVEKIKAAYEKVKALTNDELRALSAQLQQRIVDNVADENARISTLKAEIPKTEIYQR